MNEKIVALYLVLACTPVESEYVATAPEPAPPVVVEPEPEPAPAVAKPVAEPAPTPFHVVGTVGAPSEGDGAPSFRLYEVGDELVVTAGPQVMHVAADGSVKRDPQWLVGLTTFRPPGMGAMFGIATWAIVAAGGRWPDAFFITLTAESGSRGEAYPNAVYRRVGDGWVAASTKGRLHHSFPRDLAPWKDGSVLALRGFTPAHELEVSEDETKGASEAEIERAQAAIAREKPLIVIRGVPKAPGLGRRDLAAFDAIESGEIIAVVEGESPLAVHYDPAANSTRERTLPAAARGLMEAEVLVEASARAWIYGRVGADETPSPYLARFDGEAWNDEPTPPCGEGILSYSRTKDGQAWVVCGSPPYGESVGDDSTVWRRDDGAAWQPIELPAEAAPNMVVARGRDDVWLAGGKLLHTRAPKHTVEIPTYSPMASDMIEFAAPARPFSCEIGTVLVEGDPAGEQEELRAKLAAVFEPVDAWTDRGAAGVALVEVQFRGESRLALQYNFIDRAQVKRRAKKALGDRLLDTYCVQREATRDLDSW